MKYLNGTKNRLILSRTHSKSNSLVFKFKQGQRKLAFFVFGTQEELYPPLSDLARHAMLHASSWIKLVSVQVVVQLLHLA